MVPGKQFIYGNTGSIKKKEASTFILLEKRLQIPIIEIYNTKNMKPYLLQKEELKELIAKIPGWVINDKNIEREFNFSNFIEAFSFMTKIALICEKYNHHPDWENIYSKVIIKLTSHDLGGISNLDQTLASEINNIFKQ